MTLKCDYCKKKATRNIQEAQLTWSIDADGNYSSQPIDIMPAGDNFHLCDNCEPDY